ncbi:MAG: threonine--tRNA ligase [Candidatus Zipacnadales bacterium]
MQVLGIHTDSFRWFVTEKALENPEEAPEVERVIDEECLVFYVGIEKTDESDSPTALAAALAKHVRERAEMLSVKSVVIYPYAHLVQDRGSTRTALPILRGAEAKLSDNGLTVYRAPFGWYKGFELRAKGHPLSEWSAHLTGEDAEEVKTETAELALGKGKFERYIVVDLEGKQYEVTAETFADCEVFCRPEPVYRLLRHFVGNEFGLSESSGEEPAHIRIMRQHELIDYCEVSEKGHYKWYPKGVLMLRLLLEYARNLALEWGAQEMKNPLVIRGDNNVVGELMGEFHERDYKVDGGRGICYLRYASDPLGFPFMQKVRFSVHQSPLRLYEEASCFRNEQEGEVSGLRRVRNFLMTDMHAACANEEQALEEFRVLTLRFGRLMNDVIAQNRWVLGWEGTTAFFEQYEEFLIGLGVEMRVPAFFKLMPEMTHYYAMKNEYQSITRDLQNIQVSTVQWDVKDGPRFNIGFIDSDGQFKPCPVILHASSFGSIERTMCTLLENIAVDQDLGKPPCFPLWLSPTQVRLVPVKESFHGLADELADQFTQGKVRADVDDRAESVSRKVRDAEIEWVPYIVVLGAREMRGGTLQVRCREERDEKRPLTADELIAYIRKRTGDVPWLPLPLPRRLSKRPIFFG